MAKEIERKFLVKQLPLDKAEMSVHVRQGYLSTNPTVRVRACSSWEKHKGFLTIKGVAVGITRDEFEYEIPYREAQEMLIMCSGSIVEKTRYLIMHAGHQWEVDVFGGENFGLTVAEVELRSEDEEVELPSWIGEEVSKDTRYTNAALSRHPYKLW